MFDIFSRRQHHKINAGTSNISDIIVRVKISAEDFTLPDSLQEQSDVGDIMSGDSICIDELDKFSPKELELFFSFRPDNEDDEKERIEADEIRRIHSSDSENNN